VESISDSGIYSRRWWILAVLCLSVLLVTIDNTIVNVALPTLSRKLGTSTTGLQWVVDAYTLVFSGLLLAAGAVGDRFGRKKVLQAGLVLFAVASLRAALSDSTNQLIAARAAMGLGAALVYPATLALLAVVFVDRREKATAIGIWSGASGLAIALGPVSGGALLRHYAWPSIFVVNLPIAALAVAAGIRLIPESHDRSPGRFDTVGAVASVAAIGVLIWSVIEAPTRGWAAPGTVLGLAAAFLLVAGFIWWEKRRHHPLLEVALFRNPRFSAASAGIAMAFFGLFGFIFLITQFFQAVRGFDTLGAGLATLPFALVVGALSPVAIVLMKRVGTKIIVGVGLIVMSVGFLIAAISPADAPYWGPIVLSMVTMAAGLAFVTGPATDAVMGALSTDKAGVGSAVNDTTRQVGGALGVAVIGSTMNTFYRPHLTTAWTDLGVPAGLIGDARQSVMASFTIAPRLPVAVHARQAASDAFMDGLHAGSFTAAAVTAAAAIGALIFLPGRERSEGFERSCGVPEVPKEYSPGEMRIDGTAAQEAI